MNTVTFTLNGTRLTFSEDTGALVSLWNEGCGEILRDGGGLIDIAWPVKYDYETLRADPCGKHRRQKPTITGDEHQVTLHWDALPLNTVLPDLPCLEGGIAATVYLTAWRDGRSIGMRAHVENHAENAVRQVLFPNLSGLLPIAGEEGTRFTGLKTYMHPFTELKDEGDMREQFYASKPSLCGKFFAGGGFFGDNLKVGRYFDYGGLNGGLTVYTRHWGYGPDNNGDMGRQDVTWVKLDNLRHTVRIAGVHYPTVNKGEVYDTSVYVMTPHAGGWVQGIASYKEWVDHNKHRVVPPSKRVREMLGFRTIWATEAYPEDDDAVVWSYDEYEKVADDMLEHGLNSLNVWGAMRWILPFCADRFYARQGGMETFKRVVRRLRDKGVDLVPLISVLSIWDEMKERYGFERNDGAELGWSENMKGIPNFATPYMERACCTFLHNQHNELWIKDVRDALRFLRDECGVYSICWDQYLLTDYVLYDIIREFRTETQEMYPDADFSAESTFFFEADIDEIDYTWSWGYHTANKTYFSSPYSYVVETTRPQINVDSNPVSVKYCFMDNVMMNVYPSKPDNVNGSALIADYPELSKAVKQCAALRQAYLEYFLDGKNVGDCVLAEDCRGARVTGYVKEDRVLLFAVLSQDGDVPLHTALRQFIPAEGFTAAVRDADNRVQAITAVEADERLTLSGSAGDLIVVEYTVRQ